jgi:hypothetical protein
VPGHSDPDWRPSSAAPAPCDNDEISSSTPSSTGISNGRVEGLNTKVRLLVRRAYGFHSADAALALVMLAAGPIDLKLPHERAAMKVAA